MAKKFSQFPSAASISPGDSVVGLKDGANTRFSFATVFSYIQALFVPTSRKVNNKALTSDITLDASDVGAVGTADVGVADGVASLDSNGKVPGTQLDLSGKQSTITANGILMGDGQGGVSAATAGTDYQAPLTIDATPTANSTNPVQSGGVYTDVRTRVPVYGLGKNLLRNWYFVGGGTGYGVFPVNQRGNSSYTTNGYTIDGWAFSAGGYTQTLLSSGLQITGNRHQYYLLNQKISDASAGKTVTFAIWSNYGLDKRTLVMADGNGYAIGDHFSVDISINSASHYIYIGFKSTESTGTSLNIVFYAIGLYLGTEQTLAHLEGSAWVLNEIPDYEYELYRCMTSTADPSDTYANKSLATEQQLAYVETGTTASRAYAVGEYFCWNGLLYRVTTAISSGGTFTPNTNCEQVLEGGLNSTTKTEVITSECVINDSVLIPNNVRVSVSGNMLVISGNTKTNVNGTNVLAITLPSRLAYATRAYFYMGAYGGTFIGEGYVEDHSVRMNISASSNNGVFNVVTTLN